MDAELSNFAIDHPELGVMAPDSARTIVVVSEEGEMAVALRDRVDRAYALVKDLRPAELVAGLETCVPWPWMVVGNVSRLSEEALQILHNRPILILWRGELPPGMPHHARPLDSWRELVDEVVATFEHTVDGMRLAIGLGVEMPNGALARSAELQALVAAYPGAFDVPLDAFRSAARVLASQHIALRPARTDEGMVSLLPATETLTHARPA